MLLHQLPCIKGIQLIISVPMSIHVFFVFFAEQIGCTDNWISLPCRCYSIFPQIESQDGSESCEESGKDCVYTQADLASITTREEQVSSLTFSVTLSTSLPPTVLINDPFLLVILHFCETKDLGQQHVWVRRHDVCMCGGGRMELFSPLWGKRIIFQ